MINNKILIPVLTLSLVGISAGFLQFSKVQAQNLNSKRTMTQELANKLGVDESKVTSAMDSIRSEEQASRTEKMKEKLNNAVSSGKITEAQKTAILDKHTEMQEKREQERSDFEKWLNDNNLTQDQLSDLDCCIGGKMMKNRGNIF